MRMYDIIKKKRDGGELSKAEIEFVIGGYCRGEIPDYQVSALLMAIFFSGMTQDETAYLTFAIRDSGKKLSIDVGGVRADKHSTGGVGDKTSLVVMPIVASCGVKVAKMSGRGLGHTGGTVDKLMSIDGFNVDLDIGRFTEIVKRTGIAIAGQSSELAPADKLLYALRDVTATVDSIPLIASSIMGKKLAADDDCIVLDVKCGSGAFMKTESDSVALAETCINLGKRAGKRISALITDMSEPLGRNIGNSLEVIEAIDALCGKGPKDLNELSFALATELLHMAGKGTRAECLDMATEAIGSHRALDTFASMVEAQGGNKDWVYDTDLFKKAKFTYDVCAPKSGYISDVDAEQYGLAALLLKAGRNVMSDRIDYSVGIKLRAKRGDFVHEGEPIATLCYNDGDVGGAAKRILAATSIGESAPKPRPLIIRRVE